MPRNASARLRLVACLLSTVALPLSAANPAAPGQPLPPPGGHGYLEAGGTHYILNNGYGDWSDAYLRGVWVPRRDDVVNFELVDSLRFGERGTYGALGLTHTFDDRWYGSATVGVGDGAFYWPDWRADLAINYKWGERRDIVTTLGYTQYHAPDGHVDRTGLLGIAWYAPHHVVLEGGWRPNRSSPGAVDSHSAFGAITWGEDGKQYVSLRHDRGREAYQSIGENVLLVDFPSHVTSLSWRRWISPRCGFNLRVERYESANYDRTGGEAGVFCGY